MCISNFGNRRAVYPVAGLARKPNNDASLLSKLAVKNDVTRQQFELKTFEPKAIVIPSAPAPPAAAKPQNAHIIVQHNYHDHSHDAKSLYQEEHPARGGVTTPFPLKLHEMLENVEANGHEHIVSWQPHGRCFVVHKPKEFVELLPSYFKLSKLASFQRQLNLYGFQRLTRGRDKGGYYHELFLRQKVFLAHSIQRIKVKGTGVRARSNPDQEPDFWGMGWVSDGHTSDDNSESTPQLSSPVTDKAIAQLPLQIDPPVPLVHSMPPAPWNVNERAVDNDDVVCAFGNKTFHYLPQNQEKAKYVPSGVDELLASEAEAFFEDFDFPENIGSEIEDDNIFGDMLEQMIA